MAKNQRHEFADTQEKTLSTIKAWTDDRIACLRVWTALGWSKKQYQRWGETKILPNKDAGPGRETIPDDQRLRDWAAAVKQIKAGDSVGSIKANGGPCPETIRTIKAAMKPQGWTEPKKTQVKPKRTAMGHEQQLAKYPKIVKDLLAGKSVKFAAANSGVSWNVARSIRVILVDQGRMEYRKAVYSQDRSDNRPPPKGMVAMSYAEKAKEAKEAKEAKK